MKILSEWFIEAPWGKIALISWGNPAGTPILLVHGYIDSAATFIPLLNTLPEDYYYVGFDLPGHGKSEHFPTGLTLPRLLYVVAVDVVVKHLGWQRFVYLSHSAGGETGLFYNAIRPRQISKFIFIDVGVALRAVVCLPLPELYRHYYTHYFDNYDSVNNSEWVYSKKIALEFLKKTRGLTNEVAEIVLSRNLNKIGDNKYRLSWTKHLRMFNKVNLPDDDVIELFVRHMPPSLFISVASSAEKYKYNHYGVTVFMEKFEKRMQLQNVYFQNVTVDGTHDVHLTNPERITSDVTAFLKKEFVTSTSKL